MVTKVIVGLGILFVFFVVVGSWNSDPDKSRARETISFCWKEQQKKSLDPNTARFVASTCEKMEEDFRSKYRVSP